MVRNLNRLNKRTFCRQSIISLQNPARLKNWPSSTVQGEPTRVVAVIEFAQAQLDLLRIRAVRGQMMTELDSASGDLTRLRRLAALDRYEGRALARRYYASSKFVT